MDKAGRSGRDNGRRKPKNEGRRNKREDESQKPVVVNGHGGHGRKNVTHGERVISRTNGPRQSNHCGPSNKWNDDETVVSLTPEEKKLPSPLRDLRFTLKKCKKLNGFHHLPLKEAEKILMDSLEELNQSFTKVGKGLRCTYLSDVTEPFYLQWIAQDERLELLNGILTDRAKNHLLKPVTMEEALTKQEVVVVGLKLGQFFRATVEKQAGHSMLQVRLLDYGSVEEVDVKEVWQYPDALKAVPPMAIRCKFDVYNENRYNWIDMDDISRGFFRDLMTSGRLYSKGMNEAEDPWPVLPSIRFVPGGHKWDLLDVVSKESDDRNGQNKHTTRQAVTDLSIQQPTIREHVPAGKMRVTVCSVISPDEFYVQLGGTAEECDNKLQKYYNELAEKKSVDQRLQIGEHPVVGRYYIWFDRKTEKWYRVKVTEYPVAGQPWETARLWLVDEARFVMGRKESMRKIATDDPEVYGLHPARAFRVHLVHVRGLKETVTEDEDETTVVNEWLSESITFFEDFCRGKEFWAVSVTSKDLPPDSVLTKSHGIVLAEIDPVTLGTAQNVMSAAGMCIPMGPAAGRRDLVYLSYESRLTAYQEEEVKRGSKGQAPKTDSEFNNRHPTRGDDDLLNKHLHDKLGSVCISNYGSPDNFCIQMYHKVTELDTLSDEWEEHVKTTTPVKADDVVPGRVYIAVPEVQPKSGRVKYPGRMAIISIDRDSGLARALNIDYGYTVSVKLTQIYELGQRYSQIPPYCHRAHLDFSVRSDDGKILGPVDDGWTPLARRIWLRYLICGDPDRLSSYLAWQVRPGGKDSIVRLEEFNQPLRFDIDRLTWAPGRPCKSPEFAALNRNRHDFLLSQFFASIGINIVYEMKRKIEYGFVPLLSVLKKTGHLSNILVEYDSSDESGGESEEE